MCKARPSSARASVFFWSLVVIQSVCAAVFLWNIIASVFGLRSTPISWQFHELVEIAASIGLILGALFGVRAITLARARVTQVEAALKTASGAFAEVVEAEFRKWRLTEAERDVAWFSIKGLSVGEIAGLRGTSVGTIKAQSNAIYRKAGVAGRAQLLSLFVEDLLAPQVEPEVSEIATRDSIQQEKRKLSRM